MAGTGTNAHSYRALFLGYFLISSAKGWLTGVLFLDMGIVQTILWEVYTAWVQRCFDI